MFDALVIGVGPAGLAIAAALCQRGLMVGGLAPTAPDSEWGNTYGIWGDELDGLGLSHLLAHRWDDCVGYFGPHEKPLNRAYGLFDKHKLQAHLLDQCHDSRHYHRRGAHEGEPNGEQKGTGSVVWHQGKALSVDHCATHSTVTTQDGTRLEAKIVIDASGHCPVMVQRSLPLSEMKDGIAYQAAYGVVGKFSAPPVKAGRFVLMDYRVDHLTEQEREASPTFLYAMDLGNDRFFVEETSLAESPAVPFDRLKSRLQRRLAHQGVEIQEVQEEEFCLFPMNLPMPSFDQSVVGFGGAASMVHPATGYMVGALLRRAPILADGIVAALEQPNSSPDSIAKAAWTALWPSDRLRKYYIYLFGLETLMRFDQAQLCRFFNTFFNLSQSQWAGFLADTLSFPELLIAMINLFGKAPNSIRGGLMKSVGSDGQMLVRSLLS